jgi:hypothetical protein
MSGLTRERGDAVIGPRTSQFVLSSLLYRLCRESFSVIQRHGYGSDSCGKTLVGAWSGVVRGSHAKNRPSTERVFCSNELAVDSASTVFNAYAG